MSTLRFPHNFHWGTATASFTNEGAAAEDGKGESIWDRFARVPGTIVDGGTPEVACDHYHRYREDVALMRDLGLNSYSFSISWPRVLPIGVGMINQQGLDFYDRLTDELVAAGITPVVTLYHWDLPQALEDRGGWTNPETSDFFADYAYLVFDTLADRVKHWFTLNEPGIHAVMGHRDGTHAPGRRSIDDAIRAGHTMLLAHGKAVDCFREFSAGGIGIIVDQAQVFSASIEAEDLDAAQRYDEFMNRWFLDPIMYGQYPWAIREGEAGAVPPEFTPEERAMVEEPIDFVGVNYYSRVVVRNDPYSEGLRVRGFYVPDAERTAIGWEVYPDGLHKVLLQVHDRYEGIPIYVTENGASFDDVVNGAREIDDPERLDFIRRHLMATHRAIEDGVDVRGFFVYTLMDNFECARGFTPKFGLVRTDFETLDRTVKASGRWYGEVARSNALPAG